MAVRKGIITTKEIDNGNLLGKVKSVSVNINGVDHTYKGMIV